MEGDTMEKSKKHAIIILIVSLVLCVCMGLVDALLSPPYAIKSAIKLVLFGAIPLTYLLCTKSLSPRELFSLQKKHLALALPLAFGVFAVIMICLSTMFIKQHSVIDMFAAIPVCLLAEYIVYGKSYWRERLKLNKINN